MAILTLQNAKDYLRNEIGSADDTILQRSIDAAEELVWQLTGRSFAVATTSTTRYYRPNPSDRVLRIHDCASVASVTEDGAALTVAVGYQLEPLNGLSVSGQYRPYSHIRRLGQCWYTDDETATVAISAAWGWTAIPAGVVESWLILVRDITANRDVKFGLAGVTDFGGVRVRQASVIADLQAAYGSTATSTGCWAPTVP